jgi:hypothetical protein
MNVDKETTKRHGDVLVAFALLSGRCDGRQREELFTNAQWTQATTKTSYGSTLKYVFHLPFEYTSHSLSFFQQLTGHANGLSGIYERIAYTIRELQDDKAALQNRIEELEQGDPSVEVRRLREENSALRAQLATTAREKSEITWECEALLRKLNSIKLLLDGPAVRSFPAFFYDV